MKFWSACSVTYGQTIKKIFVSDTLGKELPRKNINCRKLKRKLTLMNSNDLLFFLILVCKFSYVFEHVVIILL